MKLVLDIEGLAEALSLSPDTVRQYCTQKPEKLPPRLRVDYRKPMWSVEDVQRWIRDRSEYPYPLV